MLSLQVSETSQQSQLKCGSCQFPATVSLKFIFSKPYSTTLSRAALNWHVLTQTTSHQIKLYVELNCREDVQCHCIKRLTSHLLQHTSLLGAPLYVFLVMFETLWAFWLVGQRAGM